MAGAEGMRIGILCRGRRFAAWEAECIRQVLALRGVAIGLLIVDGSPPPARLPVLARGKRIVRDGSLMWRLFDRLMVSRKAASIRPVDLTDELADVGEIVCVPEKVGKFRQRLTESDLAAIREHDLDIILRLGFGILTGEILNVARHGLWSFHHGDPAHFRGAPPGFWEIHRGSPVTGVILQRLSEALDGGTVLHQGWFKTQASSYARSLDHIYFGAAHFVARTIEDVRGGRSIARAQSEMGPIYRYPRNGAVLKVVAKSFATWIGDQFGSLFRHQHWTIGFLDDDAAQVHRRAGAGEAVAAEVEWAPMVEGSFLADPFLAAGFGPDGAALVMAEEYDWKSGLGRISAVEVDGAALHPVTQLKTAHHFSYPFLIEVEGVLHCIPECAESGEVRMYRYDRAAPRWDEGVALIAGIAAIDPTVVEHDGRWWLFCTDAANRPNEALHLWHAERLMGPWTPHPQNPVKMDVRSARPAGPLFLNSGALIRPAQDCATHYGSAVTFNRIVTLTTEAFVEVAEGQLRPQAGGDFPAGLHTICGSGGRTVVDGAKWSFQPAEFRRALRRKLGYR